MENIYLVDAKRTAIGTVGKTLANYPVSDLGAIVVKELVTKHNIDSNDIDEIITGNVLSALAGQGVGRQVVIKSGLAQAICGHTINMVCGSGLRSVVNAYSLIKAQEAKLIIAGGSENMSLAPYGVAGARYGLKLGDTKLVDSMVFDALTDAYEGIHMGITAENVAKNFNITREMQDEFAYHSQQKALNAIENGYFKEEIVPVVIKNRKGETVFTTDEHPNAGSTLEKLATLKPAFKNEGTVTAGNASGLNDGAAYVLVANEEMVEKYQFQPMAKIIGWAQAGLDPNVMGLGPAYAIEKLLIKTNFSLDDIDLFELNEAFAAQALGVVKEMSRIFEVSEQSILKRANCCGGAIALGHPVGSSGTRILTTLVHQMKRLNKKYGIAALCIGGGMGIAMLVENMEYK